MKDSVIGTALTTCFFCGQWKDVLLNTRLTESAARNVEKLHGVVMNMEPCGNCKESMEKGVMLIVIDEKKSGEGWEKQEHPSPYRTGHITVVKDDYLKRTMKSGKLLDSIIKCRWTFIGEDLAMRMGIIGDPNKAEFEIP